jgi:hypothetical protein
MTITNKHVGWGIIILLVLSPLIAVLLGAPIYIGTTKNCTGIGLACYVEITVAALVAIIWFLVWIVELIVGDREFEWHINLPKRKQRAPANIREDFLKLGTLDEDSREWQEIYKRLNNKGQWG